MGKRKSLTYAEHLDISERLRESRRILHEASVRIEDGFGRRSEAFRTIDRIIRKIGQKLIPELLMVALRDRSEICPDELSKVYEIETASETRSEDKRQRLTYEDYLEIGIRIKAARVILHDDLLLRIGNGLGTSSKAGKIIWGITQNLDLELKNELDNLVFRDHKDRDTNELIETNYGPTSNDRVVRITKR
jgi:hypothetical protein